jgi:hypothetical protein
MPSIDFVYVSCDKGKPIPLRPVKWDQRVKGVPTPVGGKKDMRHVTYVPPKPSVINTYPVAISVMGDVWEIQASWDMECERLELEARRDMALKRDAEAQEQEEIDAYAEYDMSLYIRA